MEELKKISAKLERLCVKRECCTSEILGKAVAALDGDEQKAREVLEALVAERFVDDLRYASAFAREKSGLAGWGTVKIRHSLALKKIPRETIDEALAGIDAEAADRKLRALLDTKAKSLEGDPQKKFKLIRFALSRGYEWGEIEKIIGG